MTCTALSANRYDQRSPATTQGRERKSFTEGNQYCELLLYGAVHYWFQFNTLG